MNISDNSPQGQLSSQQFYRQYSANALLPELDWQSIFLTASSMKQTLKR